MHLHPRIRCLWCRLRLKLVPDGSRIVVMRVLVGAVVAVGLFAGTARAQDDVPYAAGQFAGAATFCGVPRAEVMTVASAMLKRAGVDASGPSPQMTRFTEGVAAGVREMKDNPPATCDEVKEGFNQMKATLQ